MSDRLDQIEALLLRMAEQQEHTQRQLDQVSADVVAVSQPSREPIPDFAEMVGTLLHSLDEHSADLHATFAAEAASRIMAQAAETKTRNELRLAMLGIQNETLDILRELTKLQ